MRIIFVLSAFIAAVAAVPANPQRIVGGSTTTISAYPHIVALLYTWNGITFSQSCAGSILNNRSILTAAHCTAGDAPSRWRSRIGSTYSHKDGTVLACSSLIIHPNYNSRTIDNDVSIIRTASAIIYSNIVQAASIAGLNYHLGDNQVVWAAGWGTTSQSGSASETLRHVQIWTVNQSVCNQRYNGAITENMLCSGYLDVGGRDQCQGDSGGPLYHNGVVVGVCSWGNGCAHPYFPGVNARVSRFATWIQNNA